MAHIVGVSRGWTTNLQRVYEWLLMVPGGYQRAAPDWLDVVAVVKKKKIKLFHAILGSGI